MANSGDYRIHEHATSRSNADKLAIMMTACGITQCRVVKSTTLRGLFMVTGSASGSSIKKFFHMKAEVQTHQESLDAARKHLAKHNLITEFESARILKRMARRDS